MQHIRRAFVEVDHLIIQGFNDQVTGVHFLIQAERLVRAPCFVRAPHLASAPRLSLSSFCALLGLEPQHYDDSVAVRVMTVQSASGLAAEDALDAVSVAVLWHVVVAVLPSIRSVLLSLLVAAVVP